MRGQVAVAAGLWVLLRAGGLASGNGDGATTVVVVMGAAGTNEYAVAFTAALDRWRQASVRGGARFAAIGLEPDVGTDRQRLQELLTREAGSGTGTPGALWLVLLGHGTFDGRSAKFNLRGPDVTSQELAAWLTPVKRPLVIVNAASASAPFVKDLSAAGRVVITATKSGSEQNATRLGGFLAEAIDDARADLDKDGQTSLLEAFLVAGKRVEDFFGERGRLATEHALLDDNGDGLGTPASFYRGLRPARKPDGNASPDGYRAHQLHLVPSAPEKKMSPEARRRRDELELQVMKLRDARGALSDDAYFAKLEPLLVELARIYERTSSPTRAR